MVVKFDFSDIESFLNRGYEEVISKERALGEEAVTYAKETGTYNDVTGNLRASNRYSAMRDGIELRNDAHYASDVEARGREVLSSAALYLEKRAKEEFE